MRLIDADALVRELNTKREALGTDDAVTIHDALIYRGMTDAAITVMRMPTAVVTCQDCKYFAIKDYWGDFNGHPILATSDAPTCTKWGTGDCLTRPDGFCFLAERREADDETD